MTETYSISHLAELVGATIIGDPKTSISGLGALNNASEGDLSFLVSARYKHLLPHTNASAVILTKADSNECPSVSLVVDNPELAFAKIAALFDSFQKPNPGVHASAVIAKTASVHPSASVGANCVVGENVIIGPNTVLLSGVSINDHSVIGADCMVYSQVVVAHHVQIGDRVTLKSGAVIGGDGFGFAQTSQGWFKIPQIGGVTIHDDVEIGSNTCIDRGALSDTVIGRGVKIDNLVQIAHNVQIGENTAIAGCCAIAGSVKLGANCMVAGGTKIGGHLTICDGVVLTGNAMVTNSIKEPGMYSSGTGLLPSAKWRKMVVRLRQLDLWMKKANKQ